MPEKRTAIVTGAFGFAGANLVENLAAHGYSIYAVGRKESSHNERLKDLNINKVFLDMEEYSGLPALIPDDPEGEVYFFHLAWGGGRNDEEAQKRNSRGAMAAFDAADEIDRRLKLRGRGGLRFIGTGSQAEKDPISEYGKYKAYTYKMLKERAAERGVDFVWVRIYSLIGKYEPCGRMLPDLVKSLKEGREFPLSSCEQIWDYLDAEDAAEAIRLVAEKGRSGEDYDIARGTPRTLREYVEEAADILGADRELLKFGDRAEPFVELNPSMEKTLRDTGWSASVSFHDSVLKY